MTCSFYSKIAMMDVSYKAYFSANEYNKKLIAEGIFWLADTMETEIREKNPTNLLYCIANVADIKDIAEESFKDPTHWVGTDKFSSACLRLMTGLPEQELDQ